MEADPRVWPQGGCTDMDIMRSRQHYMDGDQSNWNPNSNMEMSKHSGYYSRGMEGYFNNPSERPAFYPDHTHMAPEMASCADPSVYNSSQVVPVGAPHGVYDNMQHQHFPAAPTTEMEHWHFQMLSQTDPFLALPLGRDASSKRKRRRVISMEQRKAANIRERRRMYQLNEAFDDLRKRVPTFAYEKKLSRIETLKLAVTYIEFMGDILENNGEKCKEMLEKAKDKISKLDEALQNLDDDDIEGMSSPMSNQSLCESDSEKCDTLSKESDSDLDDDI